MKTITKKEVIQKIAVKNGLDPKVPHIPVIIPAQNIVNFTPGKKLKKLMAET